MPYPVFDDETCIGCGACVDECPQKVILLEENVAVAENQEDCVGCGACELVCPVCAITEICEDD